MSAKDERRAVIIERVISGTYEPSEAAALLGVSARQVRRLKQAYREKGMEGVVHGNRGRPPSNRLSVPSHQKILELSGPSGPYFDYNISHLQETLEASHDLKIGRSTLDRLLVAQGIRKRRHASRPTIRRRRPRYAAEGALLQMDGSPHDWLQGRGPRLCLMGAIDDATSKAMGLEFRPTEDQAGYLRLLRHITLTYGVPGCIYHDKHTILRSPKEATLEDDLAGRQPQSQVQRVMDWLGIEAIPAHSPQAKGRIERLWGTLQDRLTKEMRLAGVMTLEDANAFLPEFLIRFNERFSQPPTDPNSAWEPFGERDAAYYFSTQESRVVKADHTVAWKGRVFQIRRTAGQLALAGKTLQVHVDPEGEVFLYQGKLRLEYTILPRGVPKSASSPMETTAPVIAAKVSAVTKSPASREITPGRRKQVAFLHAGA